MPQYDRLLSTSWIWMALVIAIICWQKWPRASAPNDQGLVVYCAHDATHAEQVIKLFEQRTGIDVEVRFDEEANKSLGLTNLLIAEQKNPRCDVFWNNQTLGTIRLKEAGVLHPYVSPGSKRIPARFKDSEGFWTGFAGRLRVYLVNTNALPPTEEAIEEILRGPSLQRVAIAQPLFGTTLSHYTLLMTAWGEEELKAWHKDQRDRGIREVRGNSMTKDLVAAGICDIGYTDTDDAFAAIDDGKPVAMLPVRLENDETICLPNSVALIANCPHPDNAKQLIDFLLSADVELLLANSSARQIPLGAVDESQVPHELQQLRSWASESVSPQAAAGHQQRVLNWLTREYTGR